jgi:hypothetical protein
MNADEYILQLCNFGLNSRELLPESSGIYYVLDEKCIIWYVGQAKNLRNRWAGESHHRFYQLQKERKKLFTIYYELVAQSQLNTLEQQRIEQYNPQLNGTKVRNKKLRPTETLLREMLVSIAPYSFVLGVESPRQQDLKFIEDCISWRDEWRVKKAVLPLTVIHICINLQELQESFEDWNSQISFLKQVFRQRPNYPNNWVCKGSKRDEKNEVLGVFYSRRLLVNGFAIEVYLAMQETVEYLEGYELTQLAEVDIRAVNEVSLAIARDKWELTRAGTYIRSRNHNTPYDQFCDRAMERLSPYKQDLVKLLLNEDVDISRLQILPTGDKMIAKSNLGLPIRLTSITTKKEYIKALLIERGLDLNRYKVNHYLERIPIDENYVESNADRRMIVYVKSFIYGDLRKTIPYSSKTYGMINGSSQIYGKKGYASQSQNVLDCPYKEVYLASTVNKAFWLLLESYLSDFVKVELNEEEGYINKAFVSRRKFLVPALLTVTLNGKWKADIPFGAKDDISWREVADIIKNRLQESEIPKLKFSLKSESTRT